LSNRRSGIRTRKQQLSLLHGSIPLRRRDLRSPKILLNEYFGTIATFDSKKDKKESDESDGIC